MMELRPYQRQAIADLEQARIDGHRLQILMMPTGSGKTATAGELIRSAAAAGNRSLFIVDRIVLAEQAVRHLRSIGLRVGLMQGANTFYGDRDQVIVASIQTLARRRVPDDVRLILIDEVHVLHKAHRDLLERYDNTAVIGLSATPLRPGLGELFTNLVKGPLIRDLVRDGYLVPTVAFAPGQAAIEKILSGVAVQGSQGEREYNLLGLTAALNTKQLVGDIVSTWQAKAVGLPTLVFAVDIAHSKSICDDFISAGVSAEHIDAYTDSEDRAEIIERFRKGRTTVLSSVNVLGVGFDVPIASCAVLARPTLSLGLHIQQVGRVMRPAQGKTHAIVLDHAANFAAHGRPEDFDVQVLPDGEIEVRSAAKAKDAITPCSSCGYLMARSLRECPECGHERRRNTLVTTVDADLVEFGSADRGDVQIDRSRFFCELKQICSDRGWSQGAAAAKYKERFGQWPPWSWNAFPPATPSDATLRWVKSRQIAYAKSREQSVQAGIR